MYFVQHQCPFVAYRWWQGQLAMMKTPSEISNEFHSTKCTKREASFFVCVCSIVCLPSTSNSIKISKFSGLFQKEVLYNYYFLCTILSGDHKQESWGWVVRARERRVPSEEGKNGVILQSDKRGVSRMSLPSTIVCQSAFLMRPTVLRTEADP